MCVALAACTSPEADRTPRPAAASAIVVGVSGAFAENQIVAEMYAQVLEHAGYQVERQLDLRSRETSQSALEGGSDRREAGVPVVAPALFLDPDAEASPDEAVDMARLNARLLRPQGITLLAPSPAEDTNQFVANAETAERFDLTTMSSLIPVADQLTLGGPPECPVRPFCLPRVEPRLRARLLRLHGARRGRARSPSTRFAATTCRSDCCSRRTRGSRRTGSSGSSTTVVSRMRRTSHR